MRVLATHRRDAAAARLALLALASLGLIAVAAAVPMRDALRTVLAGAALLGYAYFAWRAMELLQGRTLREVLDRNISAQQMPEMFTFGLLAEFDVAQIEQLVAPRAVRVR